MPAELFQEKDVKDFRYFYKRAYFIAVLAQAIKKSGLPVEVTYTCLGGNRRRPVLELTPTSTGGDHDFSAFKCTIRVVPFFDPSTFPAALNRLHPARNNLRVPDASADFPTPAYNSDLASDGCIMSHDHTIRTLAETSATVAEALILLKVWANQRMYSQRAGLSSIGHILSVLLVHLITGWGKGFRKMPVSSNAWQLFRGCLTYLSTSDFITKPLVASGPAKAPQAPTESDWKGTKKPIPVMTDATGMCNVLSEVPISSLELLRYDANLIFRKMRELEGTAFSQCFLTPVDKPQLRFDHTFRIAITAAAAKTIDTMTKADASSDITCVLVKLSNALKRGLSDRVKSISISSESSNLSFPLEVTVGLVMEPTQIARVIEYGPPADNAEEVRRFRAFWGDKAETRRFKDGRILAVVVWDADLPAERATIFTQIVRHLLQRHFDVPQTNAHFFASAYDGLLLEADQIRHNMYTDDPSVTGFGLLITAYDDFVKELKDLKGLPLAINHVTPISEALRYCSTFVPGALKLKSVPFISTAANFCPVHECIITFEGSGKWPDDLAAIQKIKAA